MRLRLIVLVLLTLLLLLFLSGKEFDEYPGVTFVSRDSAHLIHEVLLSSWMAG